jgi:TPR repeat protein
MRPLKLLVALLIFAAAPAIAGPLEDGNAAYDRGDHEAALRLWRPLTAQGDADAQYNLGFMYELGIGGPQDYAMAVSWYCRAAEQDHARPQCNLGVMYTYGHGVPQDYVLAHMWFNLAASRIDPSDRDRAVENRDIVASAMTPAQIAEAQKLAREWKPKPEH